MGAFDSLFTKGLFKIRRYGPGAKDTLGRPTRTLLSEATVNGLLQPTGTLEGEAFVVDRFRSIMPLGTDLRPADEVIAEGRVYTVEGSPFSTSAPGAKSVGVITAVLKYIGPVT